MHGHFPNKKKSFATIKSKTEDSMNEESSNITKSTAESSVSKPSNQSSYLASSYLSEAIIHNSYINVNKPEYSTNVTESYSEYTTDVTISRNELFFRNIETSLPPIDDIIPDVEENINVVVNVGKIKIPDPFRWLEDLHSDKTKRIINAMREKFKKFQTEQLSKKQLNLFQQTIKLVYNHKRVGMDLRKVGMWCVFRLNHGFDEQDILMKTMNLYGNESEYQKLLDVNDSSTVPRKNPNALVTLVKYEFSSDGLFMAYVLCENSSETVRIRIRRLANSKDLDDEIETDIYTNIAWLKQSTGFFYSKYQNLKTHEKHAIFFHRLHTASNTDVKCIEFDDIKDYQFDKLVVSHCGRYFLLTIVTNKEYGNNLYFVRLNGIGKIKTTFKKKQIVRMVYKWDAKYEYITNYGFDTLFLTDKGAPLNHVIVANLNNIRPQCHCAWKILIPQDKVMLLEKVLAVAQKTKLVLKYLNNVVSRIDIFDMRYGKLTNTIPLGLGYISEINGGYRDFNIFYKFETPVDPGTVFRYQFPKTAHDIGGWWLTWFLKQRDRVKVDPILKEFGKITDQDDYGGDDSDNNRSNKEDQYSYSHIREKGGVNKRKKLNSERSKRGKNVSDLSEVDDIDDDDDEDDDDDIDKQKVYDISLIQFKSSQMSLNEMDGLGDNCYDDLDMWAAFNDFTAFGGDEYQDGFYLDCNDDDGPDDGLDTYLPLHVIETRRNPSIVFSIECIDYDFHAISYDQRFIKTEAEDIMIPIFFMRHMNAISEAPCILYGHGSFGEKILPKFDPFALVFLTIFQGSYCIANIRGGGEFGKQWYFDGASDKRNSFNDFLNVANYLIEKKLTKKSLLFLYGDGLLISSCINIDPTICKAAIIENGVLDLIRFKHFVNGKMLEKEFGNPENENNVKYLLRFSPIHALKIPGNHLYPAVMITTSIDNHFISPIHAFKYTVTLQSKLKSITKHNPVLIRIDEHVSEDIRFKCILSKQVQYVTDMIGFLMSMLALKDS